MDKYSEYIRPLTKYLPDDIVTLVGKFYDWDIKSKQKYKKERTVIKYIFSNDNYHFHFARDMREEKILHFNKKFITYRRVYRKKIEKPKPKSSNPYQTGISHSYHIEGVSNTILKNFSSKYIDRIKQIRFEMGGEYLEWRINGDIIKILQKIYKLESNIIPVFYSKCGIRQPRWQIIRMDITYDRITLDDEIRYECHEWVDKPKPTIDEKEKQLEYYYSSGITYLIGQTMCNLNKGIQDITLDLHWACLYILIPKYKERYLDLTLTDEEDGGTFSCCGSLDKTYSLRLLLDVHNSSDDVAVFNICDNLTNHNGIIPTHMESYIDFTRIRVTFTLDNTNNRYGDVWDNDTFNVYHIHTNILRYYHGSGSMAYSP